MKTTLLNLVCLMLLTSTVFGQTFFYDNFDNELANWTLVDSDGDGIPWITNDYGDGQGNVATGLSWYNGTILTPDNWMISPAIDLSGVTGTVTLTWVAKAQDQTYADENYSVYVGTSSATGDLMASSVTFSEVIGATNDMYVDRTLDVSTLAGQTVYIAFRHHNVSDEFRLNIDDIVLKGDAQNDVWLSSLNIPNVTAAGQVDIAGTIINGGTGILNDVDLEWTDGTNTYTDNLTGLGLAPGASYSFVHTDQLNAVAGSTYNIVVTALTSGDSYLINNELSTEVAVATQLGTRLPIVEQFTSSTCSPCAALNDNAGFTNLLETLNPNDQNNAEVAVVKYQYDFPGEGDHAYNDEVASRVFGFYFTNSIGIPEVFIDGNYIENNNTVLNTNNILAYQNNPAVIDITATHTISANDEITVDVAIDPYVDLNAKLYIYLLDKHYQSTNHSSFSNGETDFYHIFRKMLPDEDATSVNLTAGTQYTTQESYSATLNPNLPAQGSHDFHSGSELEVIAFVQGPDKTIYNAAISTGATQLTGLTDYDNNTAIGVYPNPVSNDQLTVVLETETMEDAILTITDIKGSVVHTEAFGKFTAGVNKRTVDVSALKNGIYNVNVLANGHMHSKRVVIQK